MKLYAQEDRSYAVILLRMCSMDGSVGPESSVLGCDRDPNGIPVVVASRYSLFSRWVIPIPSN